MRERRVEAMMGGTDATPTGRDGHDPGAPPWTRTCAEPRDPGADRRSLEPTGARADPEADAAAPAAPERPPARDEVSTWPLGADELELAAGWLADERNAQWLDFGAGVHALSPAMLKMMTQRDQHRIWVYGPPGERRPAGLVGLGNIQTVFRTAEIWYVLGDKTHARRGLTYRAVYRVLECAFDDMGLHCVYAWTVESNLPSRRILEKVGFRHAGRIRDRHRIGGDAQDRLWYDLLAHEFERLPR